MRTALKISCLLIIGALLLSACGPAPVPTKSSPTQAPQATTAPATTKKIKAALVLPGVITDNGWNAAAYSGLQAAQQQTGCEIAYSESVPLPDYEATFRDYANKGYNIIIGHGSEFADVALLVAKEFPKTYFAVTNADVKAENVAGLDTKNEEAGYMGGFIAGVLTKSKVVGYVGGAEIVAMKRAELGFRAGAKAACPDCQILVSWVGSTNDAAKGKETGLAQIDKGADVLYQSADAAGLGVIQAANEKHVLMVGNTGDQTALAPEVIVTNTRRDLAPVVVGIVKDVANGTFKPNTVVLNGFDTGIYFLTPINMKLVTEAQAKRINDEVTKLKSGQIVLEHLSAAKK